MVMSGAGWRAVISFQPRTLTWHGKYMAGRQARGLRRASHSLNSCFLLGHFDRKPFMNDSSHTDAKTPRTSTEPETSRDLQFQLCGNGEERTRTEWPWFSKKTSALVKETQSLSHTSPLTRALCRNQWTDGQEKFNKAFLLNKNYPHSDLDWN